MNLVLIFNDAAAIDFDISFMKHQLERMNRRLATVMPSRMTIRPYMSSSDEMKVEVGDLEVDQFDELLDHPWLQFPQDTVSRNRRDRILRKEMGHQKAIDYILLTQLGEQLRMVAIIGEDTPWSRLFDMTYAPQY
ncbi:hypothetical protein E3N88_40310 [Mikania micrantha]|uniref:Uncharacterized protein n=1 Tax=Mikania micrantha TaxID=192012 RepID=A0A5N6LM93_9ASTR|nr:hypothetical protein E3N88_40310 [Mikania micrantha]